ncbi:hypothetical protein MLDJOKPK_00280 [Salmonella phage SPAsTU]|nr:hypothetical protein MLDJOKPK_00280 [Salmonella phage SPAsTU]
MAKTLQEEIIDLVNAKNPGLGLTLADVDFSSPAKHASSTEGDVRNTALTLTAKSASPFAGSKEYHYRRFDFTHPNGEDVYTVAMGDVVAYWSDPKFVLYNFNQFLPDHKLTLDEITLTVMGSGNDGKDWTEFKVKIDSEHLKWTGAMVYRVYDGKDNLQTKYGDLDGFN